MRQLFLASLMMISLRHLNAFAAGNSTGKVSSGPEQELSCTNNVSRIAFTDKIEGGQPFELWKCADQWHLSNLGDYQIYSNDDGKPCIKNSSTGQEMCCPNAQDDGGNMAARFSCHTENMSDDAGAKPEQRDTLYIEPAGKAGTRSTTTYKVSGTSYDDDSSGAAKGAKKKIKGLTIAVQEPGKAAGSGQKEGKITVTQDKPGTSLSGKTNKGGPGNSCNRDATRDGSFCQLPANILGHNYRLDKDTKGAVKDYPDGANGEQNARFDGTGRKQFSEGGLASH